MKYDAYFLPIYIDTYKGTPTIFVLFLLWWQCVYVHVHFLQIHRVTDTHTWLCVYIILHRCTLINTKDIGMLYYIKRLISFSFMGVSSVKIPF